MNPSRTAPDDKSQNGRSEATHEVAREQREYGHSSGDRNTRTRKDEWHEFEGGEQREASVDDRGDRTDPGSP
jgi:hypothetical protein